MGEIALPCEEKKSNEVVVRKKEIHPKEGQITMGEVVHAVSRQPTTRAVLVTDVGQNQMFAARYFKFRRNAAWLHRADSERWLRGLPAAIGVAFGAPTRTVCFFCGDGGLQMTIQELGNHHGNRYQREDHLLNNSFFGMVRQWQSFSLRKDTLTPHDKS